MIDGLERNRAQLTAAIAKIVAVDNVHRARMLQADQGLVTVAVGNVCLIAPRSDFPGGIKEAFVCVRAEDVSLAQECRNSVNQREKPAARDCEIS